ncbi:hypothetical protein O6H91_15G063400 [Diphasiastrum complanatum]|uniref:Uncharacterized protein n=1 Tax=Diphasiastrum complanatum TaxID=34168 RepID=A0ACC2BJ37_DIPCM|nr:hypothetical protein O6H91_15G063400 [Diphasiastrum complanatum]
MDWGNVTAEELVDALKEVEWSMPPRPLAEFFAKFTIPKSRAKWNSRFKCNLYYYRTNYFILVTLILVIGFIRNPLALIAVSLAGLSVACLNDSFAVAVSDRLTRLARRVSPPLAAKLRAPITGSRAPIERNCSYMWQGSQIHYFVYFCNQCSVMVFVISIYNCLWSSSRGYHTFMGTCKFPYS